MFRWNTFEQIDNEILFFKINFCKLLVNLSPKYTILYFVLFQSVCKGFLYLYTILQSLFSTQYYYKNTNACFYLERPHTWYVMMVNQPITRIHYGLWKHCPIVGHLDVGGLSWWQMPQLCTQSPFLLFIIFLDILQNYNFRA